MVVGLVLKNMPATRKYMVPICYILKRYHAYRSFALIILNK